MCFVQQIIGYGNKGDVFLRISTSENSNNVIYIAIVTREKELKIIGLMGHGGGELAKLSDGLIAMKRRLTKELL